MYMSLYSVYMHADVLMIYIIIIIRVESHVWGGVGK